MIPKELVFTKDKHFSAVKIPNGKLGYKKTTQIRLKRDCKTGRLMFIIKGNHKYVQDEKQEHIFKLTK